jgi:hypothetical protein
VEEDVQRPMRRDCALRRLGWERARSCGADQ